MKNNGMLESGKKQEYDIKNGKIYMYSMDGEVNCFIVRNGLVVYYMNAFVGVDHQPYDKVKAQQWFNDMKIEFEVQEF